MSRLVDEKGEPLIPEDERCPRCYASGKDLATYQMFGGHVRTVCQKCGYELKKWREQYGEEV